MLVGARDFGPWFSGFGFFVLGHFGWFAGFVVGSSGWGCLWVGYLWGLVAVGVLTCGFWAWCRVDII